jgi:glycosyltransferase involved in cell wall biosynthesis
MNIHVIGTAGVPACYGGFETLVENLIRYKQSHNITYTVYCSRKVYKKKPQKYFDAALRYVNLSPNGISSIFYDCFSMFLALKSDAMLILGVSGCFFLPLIRLLYKRRIVVNVDGLEWKRAKWNRLASQFLHLSEKSAVKYSDLLVSDNIGIVDYIKKKYSTNTCLIEYGSDHAVANDDYDLQLAYPFHHERYAVAVCRIEPENNIHMILNAFANQTDLSLVIIGNWGKSKYSRSLYSRYAGCSHFYLLEQEYSARRVNFIRCHARLYIHGHSAGGTNPSLIEAMNLGLPVLAYDCIYNRATTENKCFYWKDQYEIEKILSSTNYLSTARYMRDIASRRYRWRRISELYEQIFDDN